MSDPAPGVQLPGSPANPDQNLQPVRFIAGDDPRKVLPGMALCLSGGGYRAMVFHLGVFCRLNEAGVLRTLKRISSVSGGSISAAMLGLKWKSLRFDDKTNVAANLQEEVIQPVLQFAGKTIDVPSILKGIVVPFKGVASYIAAAYRKHLFGNATLQDLPSDDEGPRFVINATSLQTKSLWRFSRPFMGDWRVGLINNPKVDLAVAVGASSAFPPLLSPVILNVRSQDFDETTKGKHFKEPFNRRLVLADGGVYDNLGLETAWKAYDTILVSDAGGATEVETKPSQDYLLHMYRVLMLMYNQVGSLRMRSVIGSYESKLRKGAYWAVTSDIANYKLPDALPCPFDRTQQLANAPTRLAHMDEVMKQRLLNWGYAICDAALRRHVDSNIARPKGFPYPVGV